MAKPQSEVLDTIDAIIYEHQEYLSERESVYSGNVKDGFETPLWRLCRRLKGVPEMSALPALDALRITESRLFPPGEFNTGGWLDFAGICSEAEGRAEFMATWKSVRLAEGDDPIQAAWDSIGTDLVVSKDFPDPTYCKFLTLASRLQGIIGDGSIILPCLRLSELLKVSKMTITRYRRLAMTEGKLVEVSPSSFKLRDATEFRYLSA